MATSGKLPPKPFRPAGFEPRPDPGSLRPRAKEALKTKKKEPLPEGQVVDSAALDPILERRDRDPREPEAPPDARARLGDESLDKDELSSLSALLASEHLFLVSARQAKTKPRSVIIEDLGDLLLATGRPDFVKKVLLQMAEAPRILDVYPLELLAYVLERQPRFLPGISFSPFIKNRGDLEAQTWAVEEPIRLELPLQAKLRAMALEGGGAPGYHLYPGPLSEYFVELGAAGRFTLLLRAEIRKESLVDRVTLDVIDAN
ncbi:MAG: hypothetical protein U1E65_06620 [Myxococcota bacterium]